MLELLLPDGWKEAAKEQGAMQRARYVKEPAVLLRMLLFHAANKGSLRETTARFAAAGIARMSAVALLLRLRTSERWLSWICTRLCEQFRAECSVPNGYRVRAVDSTTVQGPASKGTDWRVHYALDLKTMTCDWFEVTDAHGGERLERTPTARGDVLIADRNYLRPAAIQAVVDNGAHLLVRMRWSHSELFDANGARFSALEHARSLKVGQVADCSVRTVRPGGAEIAGRVVITRLPSEVALKAERRLLKAAKKKSKTVDPRSLEACHFVMLFTTLPKEVLGSLDTLELYRYRWQIELAFKRLKSLLQLDGLRHTEPRSARTWLMAKLTLALLLEMLRRNCDAFFPWGYQTGKISQQQGFGQHQAAI